MVFSVYLNEKSDYIKTSTGYQESVRIGNSYYVCGSYNNQKLLLVTSNNNSVGMNYQELYESGTIKEPDNNTKMILGANPNGDNAANFYFNGKISVVRIYSKALSNEEISCNYLNDRERYNL